MTNRTITTSTAFPGVGTLETAGTVIARTAKAVIGRALKSSDTVDDKADEFQPLAFAPKFAVEFNRACQEELLSLPDHSRPEQIFTNIMDFVPESAQAQCGIIGPIPLKHNDFLNDTILEQVQTACPTAWCVACGKMCRPHRTDKHTAGSPCTHRSAFGKMEQL